MKKSQILAALALAFALGVVAPVVTVSDTYAFTEPNAAQHIAGSATKSDAETVYSAVLARYPIVTDLTNLQEIVYGKNDLTGKVGSNKQIVAAGTDLAHTTTSWGADAATVATGITGELVANFGMTASAGSPIRAIFDNNANYVDQINAAIAQAALVPDYSAVTNIFAAKTDGELQAAIASFNSVFGTSIDSSSNVTLANWKTVVAPATTSIETQVQNAISAAHPGIHAGHIASMNYAAYQNLYNKVVAATEARDKYQTAYNTLLAAEEASVLSDQGMLALDGVKGMTNPTVAGLIAVVNNPTTGTNFDYTRLVGGAQAWFTVAQKLHAMRAVNADSAMNYNDIMNVAAALKDADGALSSKTKEEIAKMLLAYTGPVETLPEKPTTPADEEEAKNLPNAGNTGVVAGADATAKATVSIMAAIASIATAAFVAIRKIAAGKKA